MNIFAESLISDELEISGGRSSYGRSRHTLPVVNPPFNQLESEFDDEWSTPLAKISRLYYDHESWSYAREILEAPSPACRKVGDEVWNIAPNFND